MRLSASTTLTLNAKGEAGKDAVVYRIVPSYSSVTFRMDSLGNWVPDINGITLRVTKQTGVDSPTTMSADVLSAEGLSLKFAYLNDPDSFEEYSNLYGILTAAPKKGVKAVLSRGSVELDAVTVPYILDGEPGADGVTYTVILTPSAVSVAPDGSASPGSDIVATAYKTAGGTTVEADDGVMKRHTVRTTGNDLLQEESTMKASLLRYFSLVEFQYEVGDVVVAKTALTINRAGDRGSRGPALRTLAWSDCADGFQFFCGDEGESFIDIVIYNAAFYLCKTSHSKSAANAPLVNGSLNDSLWSGSTAFDIVATKILLAEYALIKNLGVEALEMKDAAGNILCSIKDGKIEINTGEFNNIKVAGDITANSLSLKINTAEYGEYPDGSLLLSVSDIVLPDLPAHTSRSMKIMNVARSRAEPEDLVLKTLSPTVTVTKGLDELIASQTLTISRGGYNSGKSYDLMGINDGSGTIWFLIETYSTF